MAKKKKKKNGKIKKNGNVGGKADVHLSSNGGRNKSLLGHNAIFTPDVIDDIHIKSQLGRIVLVHKVVDLTSEGDFVSRELIFVKVKSKGEKRVEALRTADIFRAKVVDSTKQSFIFELTGSSDKLNAFILLMKDLGLVEVARTGSVAISRGSLKIN